MNILRLKENKFYIAYRRNRGKETSCPLYVIYRQEEFSGGILGEYRKVRDLWFNFNKATREALIHEKEITK